MHIIKEQFGKIRHFLIILIPLFALNALFNLKYDWGAVSTIARVYIMVLSFYIIFLFSQINVDDYRKSYTDKYGWKGKFYLFGILLLFPFIFIYFLTMVFVLINYLDRPHWPIEPILRIFDGRYSNTAVYPFILFVVLKLKKRPGVSIPLFIICSIFYYIADHRLYALFEPGSGVMYIKLTKYFLFTFVLVYGYSKSRYRLAGAFILSSVTGVAMYSLVTSFLLLSFFSSPTGSSALQISGAILLKSGYQFPLKKLLTNALDHADTADTKSIIQFIDKHGIDTGYTAEEWESIILKNDIRNIEFIFRHLNRKNIQINFEVLKTYAKSQLKNSPPKAAELTQFTKYFGQYYPDNKKDFFEFYKSGNEPVKIIILRSLAYTEDYYAVMFLIDRITSVEPMSAESAYASLKKISVSDPAAELKKSRHDYEVVQHFRDFASKMKR